MLELGNYSDSELAIAINVSLSTLKSKRKVTELRNLKDYEWYRDKKKKMYTIHSYKELVRNSLEDTFEALLADFSQGEVPLKNKLKALIILITIYKIDDNFADTLALYAESAFGQINKREIFRYVQKFKELGLLVEKKYDFYIVDEEWTQISELEAESANKYWWRIFIKQVELRNIPPHAPKEKFKMCREIAKAATEEEFGIIRRVEHKELTDSAQEYFKSFLEYAGKQLRLISFQS
jgi:hypothetical protein